MINNVVLVGRLTRDVDLRYTGSGTAVGNFTIALDRPFQNANGERETDFINCQIWRKPAENMANFTRKGSLVGITGRIQTRNYTNDVGQKVYITEVVAEDVRFMDSKSKSNTGDSQSGHANTQQSYQKPQNQTNSSNSGIYTDPSDISDDDLPF